MFTVANFLSRSQQQQQTKERRDFPLLHILFLACFFSFQLSRISRLFQNDEKENLKDFRARTIQKFTKEGIPNFLKIKKFASPIISRLSFYGEVLKTTHTHTHAGDKKKKRENYVTKWSRPPNFFFFYLVSVMILFLLLLFWSHFLHCLCFP